MTTTTYASNYDYPPEECDVEDKAALRAFRAQQDEWLHWLRHDEQHAITLQIAGMLSSDAMFRLINESRRHASEADGSYATQSSVIARALDRGYVAEQVIAFRKLWERGTKDRKRQVISLRRLIDDVKAKRRLLTREMFVCHDGLPFDCDGGDLDLPEPDEHGVSFGYLDVSGPLAYDSSRRMHEQFDEMMDSIPAKRERGDLIGDAFFQRLEDLYDAAPFEDLRVYANKILLHAADEFSRGSAVTNVTLNKFWECHWAILTIANRMSLLIGGNNIGGVPVPQYDVLEHWDEPFAPKERFDSMMENWRAENNERDDWTQGRSGSAGTNQD